MTKPAEGTHATGHFERKQIPSKVQWRITLSEAKRLFAACSDGAQWMFSHLILAEVHKRMADSVRLCSD
jgi:hypothetical protein